MHLTLRALVHELDIGLHLVSHVSAPRKLRGSQGIKQLADAVIFLNRDKDAEEKSWRNITEVYVDKNRFAGDVGIACYLEYQPSGRMKEVAKPHGFKIGKRKDDDDEFF